MTEFTKNKMHFALALIGALFALHPFLDKLDLPGLPLPYLDEQKLEVFHVYALIAGLLALTVYCYGVVLLSERTSSWTEKAGNFCYAVAIMLVPLYGGLYLMHLLAVAVLGPSFVDSHLVRAAPLATIAVGVVFFFVLTWWLRNRLGEQDRSAKAQQFEHQEIESLKQAREMFNHDHYDLAVIEAWKAIEARLRRGLLRRGITKEFGNAQKMIEVAHTYGIVRESSFKLLQELRQQWNIAVSVEPLTREAAESALTAARHILSTIALEDPTRKGPPKV